MEFAAKIAPEIDRLVLAVNVTAGNRIRTPATEMAQDLGLERAGALKHYPEFLLHASLDESIAIARLPYRSVRQTSADIDAWRRLGLVTGPPEAMVATNAVTPLLNLMLATTRDVAADLWDAYPSVVDDATALASLIIDGLDDGFAVAVAHRAVPRPDDRYLALHRRLTTLRYARAWAHVRAWTSHGFDAEEVKVLTALWHGEEVHPGPVLAALAGRGLAEEDGTGLTAEGFARRELIERDTNENAEPIFASVSHQEVTRFLASLVMLPGVAPG
jgi:hypothetical protein